MTNTISALLVGMHFRPPAKQILEILPARTQLVLIPEPENPYDEKAIKVMVDLEPFSDNEELMQVLDGTGVFPEDLLSEGLFHLGYIADSDGKICQKSKTPGNREIAQAVQLIAEEVDSADIWPFEALLTFSLEGKPQVTVESF